MNALIDGLNTPLPLFQKIQADDVLPALEQVMQQQRQHLDALLQQDAPSWSSLMEPLEAMDNDLARIWGPVTHLNAVCDSEALRQTYQQGVQKVSAWHTDMAQNKALFQAIKSVATAQGDDLSLEQQALLQQQMRDFRLSGSELEGEDKERFKAIRQRLSELTTLFEQHVLDATRAFRLHLTDEQDLAGLPASVRDAAAQRAASEGNEGWLFTLDMPSYLPLMQYADKQELREQAYRAYVTRASFGDYDNTAVMDELLALRHELAQLLSFACFADYSLATKMADSTDEVFTFLHDLAASARPVAEQEWQELQQFAADVLGLDKVQAWDVPYVSEKLRVHTYDVSQEVLKPYFPEQQVLSGLFSLVNKMYGIEIRQADAEVWHPDARYYDVCDANGDKLAGFYLDPYARAHKRGGAWMDECVCRWLKPDGVLQHPVAYLVCNFDAPVGDKPALWTHDEVMTLFHEFGHGLHHMLTNVDTRGVSGIQGVPWDAVELPSQLMENFCWEREVLDLFARHYETGERIPEEMFQRMIAAKNFQSGLHMLRQLEFSMFDLRIHSHDGVVDVQKTLDAVRQEVSVVPATAFNRFQHGFSHIFAGGYGAGYYSYKWAEVLSADVYAAFEEEGVLNADTAQRFLQCLLSIGGSRALMDGFVAFRGRKPNVQALLRHSGLA